MITTANDLNGRLEAQLRERHREAAERYRLQVQEAERLRADHERGDVADAGAHVADTEQQELLAAALLGQMRRIEEALARLEAGQLGACQRCGQEVPASRLEIMPWATHCMPCQQAADRRG
jgi:DnaK suppressor protein